MCECYVNGLTIIRYLYYFSFVSLGSNGMNVCVTMTMIIMVISPAVPGQVENLAAFFVSTGAMFDSDARMYTLNMDITWDEPTYPNGVITSYEVTVSRTDDSNDMVYNDDILEGTSVTTSVMVLPFTNYTVTVAASTSEGQGENISVTEESPEAGNWRAEQAHLVLSVGRFFYTYNICEGCCT